MYKVYDKFLFGISNPPKIFNHWLFQDGNPYQSYRVRRTALFFHSLRHLIDGKDSMLNFHIPLKPQAPILTRYKHIGSYHSLNHFQSILFSWWLIVQCLYFFLVFQFSLVVLPAFSPLFFLFFLLLECFLFECFLLTQQKI